MLEIHCRIKDSCHLLSVNQVLGTGPSEFPLAAVTKLGAYNDRNVSSHRSGRQESAVKVGAGPCSPEASRAGSCQSLHLLVAAGGPWLVTTSL